MLKGFVFYWGMHYYSVFRIFTGDKFEWVRFDDTSITKKTWEEVLLTSVETCCLPTLIFYEKLPEDHEFD